MQARIQAARAACLTLLPTPPPQLHQRSSETVAGGSGHAQPLTPLQHQHRGGAETSTAGHSSPGCSSPPWSATPAAPAASAEQSAVSSQTPPLAVPSLAISADVRQLAALSAEAVSLLAKHSRNVQASPL